MRATAEADVINGNDPNQHKAMQQKSCSIAPSLRTSSSSEDWLSYASFRSSQIPPDRILVALLSAYFDESGGTTATSPLTCSAAYVFKEEGLRQFYQEWEPFLTNQGWSHFHATEHNRPPDGVKTFNKLRELIFRTTEKGFVPFAFNETLREFNTKSAFAGWSGTNNALLTLSTMSCVAEYAKTLGSKVVYYIEDSHDKSLWELAGMISTDTRLREMFALSNISFPRKRDAIQLQSADLLAWSFHRLDDSLRTPIPEIDPAPGIDNLKEWVAWYKGHSLRGLTYQGLETIAVVNAANGLRLPKPFKAVTT